MSSEKHNQDQAQLIIFSLAKRELELQQMTDEAKAEAEKIVEAAKAEASSILKAAELRCGEVRLKAKKEILQKTDELLERRQTEAREQAVKLEKLAQANTGPAVDLIVRQVFPESE